MNKAPKGHWAGAERLRFVQCLGAGVDSVLPAPDLAASVRIANNRGMSAEPMAEFALALVLGLMKRLPGFVAAQGAAEWRPGTGATVAGATLGILGLGAIGLALARKADALGMRVVGTQRVPKPDPAVARIVPPAETRALLSECDVVVLLMPLTDETRGAFGAAELAAMKPGAHLVNVARGGIVDEAALVDALESGKLASAAFDVFAEEPLPAASPLWRAPNLWITPHIAGGFPEFLPTAVRRFGENVRRVARGEPPENEIDRTRGY